MVTTAAFAAGISAVPTPITEVNWEGWMWHQYFQLFSPIAQQASNSGDNILPFEIDSKAMRKVGADMTVFAAVEATEVGAATLTGNLGTRMLLKLS